jgi:hypothetical protein
MFTIEPKRDLKVSRTIENFLAKSFSGSVSDGPKSAFEAVCSEFFSTKFCLKTPDMEQYSTIRDIIHSYMEGNEPIEVLIPWGSSKREGGLDVLELSALQSILCLAEQVKLHYPPGIHVTILMKDVTGYIVFPERWANSSDYPVTLQRLIAAIGCRSFVDLKYETDFLDVRSFEENVQELTPRIARYLRDTDVYPYKVTDDLKVMKLLGWKGTVPQNQRDYYRWIFTDERTFHNDLAKYFACSIARRIGGGNTPITGSAIRLHFGFPAPGISWKVMSDRLNCVVVHRMFDYQPTPWEARGCIDYLEDCSCQLRAVRRSEKLQDTTVYKLNIGSAVVETFINKVEC